MTSSNLVLNLVTCCAMALLLACNAKDDSGKHKSAAKPIARTNTAATVSAKQISIEQPSPDDVSQTPLGTLVIRHSDDTTNTAGKIFLNGELIYTARSAEVAPDLKGKPFDLELVSWEENGKERPHYRITKMVMKERSHTCQYIVLDFTGPKVWISKRFPKDAGYRGGECVEMTWVRWEKSLAFFYFGADESDWDKDGYHGWVEGYNPKLKAVFGPVDAPPPPKNCSLIPKPTNPDFREAGEPTCEEK